MTEGLGRVIAGRYRLVARLGHGGMGVVWRARDEVLGREVAVKEIGLPVAGSSPDDLVDLVARRALREARAAARLRHPAIVTVHDVVTDEGRPWIVMELVRGRSLAEVIAADGALPERRAAEIGLRVLGALDAAHRRGILHRDVKPANIMLDGDRVVLTDFGIAVVDGATALTGTGLVVGSPDYLAPERINGGSPTAAVDLWGLGVTLYAVVAGRPPFRREDAQSTLAAVLVSDPAPLPSAPELWPIIRGLLAKSPESRLSVADTIPMLAAATRPAPVVPPRQRRWTAMFPGRSRSRATSLPTSPAPQVSVTPAVAVEQSAVATPAEEHEERVSQLPAVAGEPPAVEAEPESARAPVLIASSAVVLLLLAVVGWVAWRGPDDPLDARTRGTAAASAGIGHRTAAPNLAGTTTALIWRIRAPASRSAIGHEVSRWSPTP